MRKSFIDQFVARYSNGDRIVRQDRNGFGSVDSRVESLHEVVKAGVGNLAVDPAPQQIPGGGEERLGRANEGTRYFVKSGNGASFNNREAMKKIDIDTAPTAADREPATGRPRMHTDRDQQGSLPEFAEDLHLAGSRVEGMPRFHVERLVRPDDTQDG